MDFNALGKLGEFLNLGSSAVTNHAIDAEQQDREMDMLPDRQLDKLKADLEKRVKNGRMFNFDTQSQAGSRASDYHGPPPGTTAGALYTMASKVVEDIFEAEREAPTSTVGSANAHVKFACSDVGGKQRIGSPFWEHLVSKARGDPTVVFERLFSFLKKSPDEPSTDRLQNFVDGTAAKQTYRVARTENGG